MHLIMTASAAGSWQTTPKALPNTFLYALRKRQAVLTSRAWTPVIRVTLQSPLKLSGTLLGVPWKMSLPEKNPVQHVISCMGKGASTYVNLPTQLGLFLPQHGFSRVQGAACVCQSPA